MRSVALAKPHRFRFTEPADVKAYGDGWHLYDEAQIVRLPARQLMRLETEVGRPVVDVIDLFRADYTFGRLAGTWIALHLEDPALAGPFAGYEPVVMLLDFEQVEPEEDMGAPLDPTPSESSQDSPSTE